MNGNETAKWTQTNAAVSRTPIAVTGLGCWYPGARDPARLWENVLSRRLEFRRIPDERLRLEDYHGQPGGSPDLTYARRAAVIDGFTFDWSGRRIPKSMYESTDVVHWLALEVAERALEDAGYTRDSIPRTGTGVIVGNTLTGDVTRANCMRLRWPFVRRALEAAGAARGLPPDALQALEETMEDHYKSVFPELTEDSLAGGLANTIAGRICNYFDLHGGGYLVDGACSSSLLAVCTAARALSTGDLDMAVAGGIDISIDPFELVGFSRVGALARDGMHVYDKRAAGFIPGEGCGFVVLKRLEDARRDGDAVYAVLRGWGISSDGKGGLMTPTAKGQELAIRRAYTHAGYSPRDLDFVEGHGTGTRVGDQIELEAIAAAMSSDAPAPPRRTGVTSLKSIIGHTKAAAGIGAFIKTVIAVNRRVLPPLASCSLPHDAFGNGARPLYPIRHGKVEDRERTLRAGVSAMGFGGINTHVTLESADAPIERLSSSIEDRALLASAQDSEVFVFTASAAIELRDRLRGIATTAERLSVGDLADLAAELARQTAPSAPLRAAAIAGTPEELAERLTSLESLLTSYPPDEGEVTCTTQRDVWLSNRCRRTRVGFLLPGQGSQQLEMGRRLFERFRWTRELVELADEIQRERNGPPVSEAMFPDLDRAIDPSELDELRKALSRTEAAQPAICTTSVLYARFLDSLGIRPVAVGGHSLGELTAFHLAGALDTRELLELASLRGLAMAASPDQPGAMAALHCSVDEAQAFLGDARGHVVVANVNSPKQVVVSGDEQAVLDVVAAAEGEGVRARRLPVSNAFHSRLVAAAADRLRDASFLPRAPRALDAILLSGIDGSRVGTDLDLREHFATQVLQRVDFVSLVEGLEPSCDMLIEVGPGRVLSALANDILTWSDVTCLPVAGGPSSDRDLNAVVARAFVHGIDVRWEALYEGRLIRPFVAVEERQFIGNPCERAFTPTASAEPLALAAGTNGLEETLLRRTGVDASVLEQYLGKRAAFLSEVVLADLRSISSGSLPGPGELSELVGLGPRTGPEPFPDDARAAEIEASPDDDVDEVPSGAESPGSDDLETLLVELVHERTGFPIESISMELRLLEDLNLDSIKAGDIIATAARRAGASGAIDPASLANANLADVVRVVRSAIPGGSAGDGASSGAAAPSSPAVPDAPGGAPVESGAPRHDLPEWVRSFTVDYVESALATDGEPAVSGRRYGVLHDASDAELASAIAGRLRELGAEAEPATFDSLGNATAGWTHVVSVLPNEGARFPALDRLEKMAEHLRSTVALTRASVEPAPVSGVAFVQRGGGRFGTDGGEALSAASFARSLHLEAQALEVRAVDLSPELPREEAARLAVAELGGADTFRAAGYDFEGVRREPCHRLTQPAAQPPLELEWSPDDVVLVTGGGRGITAECALALARRSGAKIALVGSSPPPGDEPGGGAAELAATLSRFEALGCRHRYFQCDVTGGSAVARLVEDVASELGSITAVLHGAGRNQPRLANSVTVPEAAEEVSPKVLGAVHLVEALGARSLKLFAGLTSIIGVAGIPGNAWYAFSNEALDLVLRRYQEDHPETVVRSLSYSAWRDVGMGAKLEVVQHLHRMGVGTIPTGEGVSRFLHGLEHDTGDLQVVITGSLGGLDTWRPFDAGETEGLRFIERTLRLEPQVELVARATLSLGRDLYLADHVYRGSRLFPAVFGLEAMAQAAARLLGPERPPIARIENVELTRPIVVGENGAVEIEIRAEAFEIGEDGRRRVRVGIRSALSGFSVDHFAADVVCGPLAASSELPMPTGEALPIDPQADLYGDLLFQGPLFQRWGRTFALGERETVFEVERRASSARGEDGFAPPSAGPLLLGDPYCHDVLLQSTQTLMPQHVGLPVRIECIELLAPEEGESEDADTTWTVTSIIRQLGDRVGEENVAEVVAVNDAGRLVMRLTGYVVKILEIKKTNPTHDQLADLEAFDESLLVRSVDETLPAFNLTRPTLVLRRMPGLHELPREERHELERPVMERALDAYFASREETAAGVELEWSASGRPTLSGADAGDADLSLAHDDDYCLCVVGAGRTGCDIAPVTARSEADWLALVGGQNQEVLAELIRRGDPLNRAGTRIWAAMEAARKSVDENVSIALRVSHGDREAVTLAATVTGSELLVFTVPVDLWRKPERVVAFVTPRQELPAVAALKKRELRPGEVVELDHFRLQGRMDGPQGQPVFEHRFVVTFKECGTRGRRVQFSQYLGWMGMMRENALLHLVPNLMAQLSGGEWGMATNWADVTVTGEAMTGDVMQARLWMDAMDGSSVSLCCDFSRVASGERLERLAFCKQKTTWVRLQHRANPSPEPFPPFLAEAFQVMAPRNDEPTRLPDLPEGLRRFDAIRAKLREQSNGSSKLVRTDELVTCLDDANLVGNIYYSRYFSWQARACDLFLHEVVPEIVTGSGTVQELVPLRSRIDFMRDAFPFDRIRTELRVRCVTESAATLEFVFDRVSPDGSKERLSMGEQDVVWVRRAANGSPVPAPFPDSVRRALEAAEPRADDDSARAAGALRA